ncbi:MAG: choice-of-anchor tandem repeat NxxGxxAF-containing protein [Planctomycetota bacterium]
MGTCLLKIRRLGLSLGMLTIALGHGGSIAKAATFHPVVLSGESTPDAGEDIRFTSFSSPAINRHGQVAFRANILGPGVPHSYRTGLYAGGTGSLRPLMRAGAPLGDGLVAEGFGIVTIDDSNRAHFAAAVLPEGETRFQSAWFTETHSGPELALEPGGVALVEGEPVKLHLVSNHLVARNGDVYFKTLLQQPIDGSPLLGAVLRLRDGVLDVVSREGDAIHGAPTPSIYRSGIPFVLPLGNRLGDYAVIQKVTRLSDGRNGDGLMVHRDGETRLLYDTLHHWEESPFENGRFGDILKLGFNDAGTIVFNSNEGIYQKEEGPLRQVVRIRDQAPGSPEGVVFVNTFETWLSGRGDVVFEARLGGPGVTSSSDEGLYVYRNAEVKEIARLGGAAPGASPEQVFRTLDPPLMNARGQILFSGYLTGSGISASNDRGLWMLGPEGDRDLLLREGDWIDIDPSLIGTDLRQVAHFFLHSTRDGTGGEDARLRSLNDAGQLAFSAQFTDGSWGVFVAETITAVPAPGTFAGLGVGFLFITHSRRRALDRLLSSRTKQTVRKLAA